MNSQPLTQVVDGLHSLAQEQEEVIHHESHREKEKKESGLPPVKMTVNLTAMIDVIFQLLIYFVVTANFAANEGVLTANVPEGPGTPRPETVPPENALNIRVQSVGADGLAYRLSIEGNAQPTDFLDLARVLISLQFDPNRGLNGPYKPDNKVVIKPDPNVRWQHVVNAFNAAVKARYTNIRFGSADAPAEADE